MQSMIDGHHIEEEEEIEVKHDDIDDALPSLESSSQGSYIIDSQDGGGGDQTNLSPIQHILVGTESQGVRLPSDDDESLLMSSFVQRNYGEHQRGKMRRVTLTDNDELKAIELIRNTPYLYNASLEKYKDSILKNRSWEKIGAQMNPRISGVGMKTWFATNRTVFTKLKRLKSADPAKTLTPRQTFILSHFEFLKDHRQDHKSRASSFAARSANQPTRKKRFLNEMLEIVERTGINRRLQQESREQCEEEEDAEEAGLEPDGTDRRPEEEITPYAASSRPLLNIQRNRQPDDEKAIQSNFGDVSQNLSKLVDCMQNQVTAQAAEVPDAECRSTGNLIATHLSNLPPLERYACTAELMTVLFRNIHDFHVKKKSLKK